MDGLSRRLGTRRSARGAGEGGGYDPTSELGGARFALRARGTVTEEGTGVSSWIEQVSSFNFAQGTDANRPSLLASWRNGKRAVDFNGTSDRLSATLTADQVLAASVAYTVLVYGELDALKSATQSLIDFGGGRSWILFETANAGNPIGIFDEVSYRSVGADPSTGPHTWEWSVAGGATGLTVYQDGVALGTTPDTVTLAGLGGSTFLGSIDTGASAFFDGKLADVFVFPGLFDAGARSRSVTYGRTEYAMP